ncbi:signal peptidase I [Microbacterium terricola]|uniref:Signal peptidase I n=1 Tax=Microbacterium terricola TaxID=344163 RepID=A0ABM8E2N9_9MICO|nr:signal peptidase I [Microbacterium terricola]UYK40237.1 signal peptidase I [Microbacterium terricola]BDV32055.1 hypothetical protein Microterr_27150 [Microbacterium terricola]
MTTPRRQAPAPGWRGRPIEDLSWPVLIRVAVCWGVLCMILTLLAAAFVPRPFGFIGTTVVTGSMRPSIQPGDVALVWPVEEYALGQVILFIDPSHPEQQIMHRIIEVREDGMLVTKGDANESADSTPVHPANVIGVGSILVPAIGLPIVWAVQGAILLIVATVLLTALLVRGTLRIEFLPNARKSAATHSVLEAGVVIAMLVVAVLVVVVGVARSSHAAFSDRSSALATWAMGTTTPPPSGTCSVKGVYHHWPGEAIIDFTITNNTGTAITASPERWVLVWSWTGDEQVKYPSSGQAESITQSGQVVTYIPWSWSIIEPGEAEPGQVHIASATDTFLPPKDFFLNGAPCDYIPPAGPPIG